MNDKLIEEDINKIKNNTDCHNKTYHSTIEQYLSYIILYGKQLPGNHLHDTLLAVECKAEAAAVARYNIERLFVWRWLSVLCAPPHAVLYAVLAEHHHSTILAFNRLISTMSFSFQFLIPFVGREHNIMMSDICQPISGIYF